ncbi:MAG: CoA transferase, partial [Dietzia sp.]|nr:CoA transferase [Dietzia sp.]
MAEGALLPSLRVLDLSSGEGDGVGRILADLGADVLKIEPPGDNPARRSAPLVGHESFFVGDLTLFHTE